MTMVDRDHEWAMKIHVKEEPGWSMRFHGDFRWYGDMVEDVVFTIVDALRQRGYTVTLRIYDPTKEADDTTTTNEG